MQKLLLSFCLFLLPFVNYGQLFYTEFVLQSKQDKANIGEKVPFTLKIIDQNLFNVMKSALHY